MRWPVIVFALASLGLYTMLVADATGPSELARLGFAAAALAALYVLLLYSARRLSLFGNDLSVLIVLGAVALAIRLIVVVGGVGSCLTSPESPQCFEQGRLLASGVSPYSISADDTAAGGLGAPMHPPLAQYLFALAYLLHWDSLVGMHILSCIFELLTLLSILVLIAPEVERRPFTSWSVLIYAFSPLVILAFPMAGYSDILALPFFIFSLVFVRRDRPLSAGIFLALASLTETLGLAFFPVLLFHFTGRDRLRFGLGFAAASLLILLPHAVTVGLSPLVDSVAGFWRSAFGGAVFQSLFPFLKDDRVAGMAAGAIFLMVVAAASYPLRGLIPKVSRRLLLVATAFALLAPALLPHSLIWMMPFVVLRRDLPHLALTVSALASFYLLLSPSPPGALTVWLVAAIIVVPFLVMIVRNGEWAPIAGRSK